MLVIVKYRDIQHRLQPLFNFEAGRGADIFEGNSAKCGRNGGGCLDEDSRVVRVDFNVEDVDICKFFEEHPFPFHHGF